MKAGFNRKSQTIRRSFEYLIADKFLVTFDVNMTQIEKMAPEGWATMEVLRLTPRQTQVLTKTKEERDYHEETLRTDIMQLVYTDNRNWFKHPTEIVTKMMTQWLKTQDFGEPVEYDVPALEDMLP